PRRILRPTSAFSVRYSGSLPGWKVYVRSSYIMDISWCGGSSVGGVRGVHRVVLAEGVAFPVLGEEDAPRIGVAVEGHAEHVVALALHPVGAAPQVRHGRTVRVARGQGGAHHHGP